MMIRLLVKGPRPIELLPKGSPLAAINCVILNQPANSRSVAHSTERDKERFPGRVQQQQGRIERNHNWDATRIHLLSGTSGCHIRYGTRVVVVMNASVRKGGGCALLLSRVNQKPFINQYASRERTNEPPVPIKCDSAPKWCLTFMAFTAAATRPCFLACPHIVVIIVYHFSVIQGSSQQSAMEHDKATRGCRRRWWWWRRKRTHINFTCETYFHSDGSTTTTRH